MRYLTRELERKMQFFGIAFEKMNLDALIKHWSNNEHSLDVYKIFYQELEEHKEYMLRLLPEDLKNKIYNHDGSIKEDILNEELYKDMVAYKRNSREEWKAACNAVNEEGKRFENTLPNSIKKLRKLYMHDEQVAAIYYKEKNKLILELKERAWGKPLLIFKGMQKADISNIHYPAWWLYDELFELENSRYEFNILFSEGEISINFEDFEIRTKPKKYIDKIIDDFSTEAIEAKLEEAKKRCIEATGKAPDEDAVSEMKNMMFGDRGFFDEVSNCIGDKMRFAGKRSLSKIEQEIALLNEFLNNLIYDTVNAKSGFKSGGFHNIEEFSKAKLDNILKLLKVAGPKYLYRITLEARYIFEESNEEEKAKEIDKLNARIKRRYGTASGKSDEIYTAFADYIKADKDKF